MYCARSCNNSSCNPPARFFSKSAPSPTTCQEWKLGRNAPCETAVSRTAGDSVQDRTPGLNPCREAVLGKAEVLSILWLKGLELGLGIICCRGCARLYPKDPRVIEAAVARVASSIACYLGPLHRILYHEHALSGMSGPAAHGQQGSTRGMLTSSRSWVCGTFQGPQSCIGNPLGADHPACLTERASKQAQWWCFRQKRG